MSEAKTKAVLWAAEAKSGRASPVREVVSPAMAELRKLRAKKGQLLAEAENLLGVHRRLQLQTDAASIRQELSALDATESAAMEEWAQSTVTSDPPQPDVARRAFLTKRLAEEEARGNAARSAADSVEANRQALIRQAHALDQSITYAALHCLREEADARAADAKVKIDAAREAVGRVSMAHRVIIDTIYRIDNQPLQPIGLELLRWAERFEFAGAEVGGSRVNLEYQRDPRPWQDRLAALCNGEGG